MSLKLREADIKLKGHLSAIKNYAALESFTG